MPQAQSLQLAIVSSCRLIARLRDLRLTADAASPEPSWSNTDPWIKSREGSRFWRFDCGRRGGCPSWAWARPSCPVLAPNSAGLAGWSGEPQQLIDRPHEDLRRQCQRPLALLEQPIGARASAAVGAGMPGSTAW
jgi:hypothetical protein